MSREFRTEKLIPMSDLFSGRLMKYGISGKPPEGYTVIRGHFSWDSGHLTDGSNGLAVYSTIDGMVSELSGNSAEYILKCIAKEFETEIYCEEQPQFWGFDTQEELDASYGTTLSEAGDEDLDAKVDAPLFGSQVKQTN